MQHLTLLSLLSTLASAHFQLNYPPPRDYDEDTLGQYPCGGQNTVSDTRTPFSLTSNNPVQLELEHTASTIQLLLAMGNNPTGDDFVYTLVPTFQEMGPGDFCFNGVAVPSSFGAMAGMNATLLAITNDPEAGGGFYNCADITFTSDMISMADYNMNCQNASSIETRPANVGANANGTVVGSDATPTSSAAGQGSTTGAAAALLPNMGLAAALGALGFAAL